MVAITFVSRSGQRRTIDVKPGKTLMEAALYNRVDGIGGDCGGMANCGTCHIYVEEGGIEQLAPPNVMEMGMLDTIDTRRPNSRLSCQIRAKAELDGLLVTVAPAP